VPAPPAFPAHRVPLDDTGRRWALLREPAGADEVGVSAPTTPEAVRFLDGLLVAVAGTVAPPGSADRLTVVDRDLLLAAVYELGWGARVGGVVTCSACGSPFDVEFRLTELAQHVREGSTGGADGVHELPGGARFRLPTGQDEAAVAHLDGEDAEQALLRRCLLAGDPVTDRPAVEAALAEVGSGMDLDLAATCPECGHGGQVRFGIQDYLLSAVRADRVGLTVEVHRLALAYRWSLGEILGLPRSIRRAFVALLDGTVPAAAEASW